MAWTVYLAEFPHCEALHEIRDALIHATKDRADEGVIWIGAHDLYGAPPPFAVEDAIIFQTECLESAPFQASLYCDRLKRARAVWDYSMVNMGGYEARRKCHVPLGRSPAFERIKRHEPRFDVGFVGSVNDRRASAFDHHVTRLAFGTYGAERDDFLGACKVVAVPHYYPNAPVEQARIIPCAAAGIATVAEYAPDFYLVPGMYAPHSDLGEAAAAAIGAYEELGAICQAEYDQLPSMAVLVERAVRCMNQ